MFIVGPAIAGGIAAIPHTDIAAKAARLAARFTTERFSLISVSPFTFIEAAETSPLA
jgi:hypothetical protein